MRVDDAREHRISLAKELASPSVGERGGLPWTSTHGQTLSTRSRTSGNSTTHSLVGSAGERVRWICGEAKALPEMQIDLATVTIGRVGVCRKPIP
jgi:hypothetical protein